MSKTKEKPIAASASFPGLESIVPIRDLCAAIAEMISVVPQSKSVKNRILGFGPSGFCILALGDVQYMRGERTPDTVWTNVNPTRILSLLSTWAKSDEAVRVVVGDSRLEFRTPDNGRFTVPLSEALDPIAISDGSVGITLDAALAKSIHNALSFVSKDSHRQVLTYVFVQAHDGGSVAVATDTHRLYVGRSPLPVTVDLLIPPVVARFAKEGTRYWPSNGWWCSTLEHGTVAWTAAGTFPNWERVVPDGNDWPLDVDISGEVAIPAVRRALIYARDNAYRIRLTPNGQTIGVSARSEEIGEVYVPFAFSTGNAGFEFALNGNYLIQALRVLGGTPQARGTASARPIRLDRDNETVVIMPMALA